jgi:signal transduction histidine kinase
MKMEKNNSLEKLLAQKAELNDLIAKETSNQINFSVDAGIIDKLGKELVGRAETAVSELVKNAYDADANNVELDFINSDTAGGTLVIKDDGHGMSKEDLIGGFMRLSSSTKVHHPVSPKYKRVRAGKKGIGRFATQRLGGKLIIKTKKATEPAGIKIEIDWSDYIIDKNIEDIYNPLYHWDADIESGTILEIHALHDAWTDAQIKRVFRYVIELLQPDFLSDRSQALNIDGESFKIATQKEGSFSVECYRTVEGDKSPIINEDILVFDRAVAVIEGYVDDDKDGYCSVTSERFSIGEEVIPISSAKKSSAPYKKWESIRNVYFKAYYFIYNRPNYYTSMSKMELKKIKDLSARLGSIRLYRNGFRVLPYGEPYNDWLKLDSKNRNRSGVNAPLGNNNFFGFVEVIDPQGKLFEETASREGLLENDAYRELRDFVYKSIAKGRDLVAGAIKLEKEKTETIKREGIYGEKTTDDLLNDIIEIVSNKDDGEINETQENVSTEQKEKTIDKVTARVKQVKDDFKRALEEMAMLRIWAGLGLTIGEFTHDVIQFSSALGGYLRLLEEQNLDQKGIQILDNIEEVFNTFRSYISFFDTGTSIAEARNIQPIDLIEIVESFLEMMRGSDDQVRQIDIYPLEIYDSYDLFTLPMHKTEWYSILFNLFSNSKKAIRRSGNSGKVKIILGQEKEYIYLEFLDNGDGIPDENKEKVFNAFFSTSTPSGVDSADVEELTGRGLGLKLIKDTLEVYKGRIYIIESPEKQFVTCFRVEIPAATKEQMNEYGY